MQGRAIQLIDIDEEKNIRTLTREGEAFLNSIYDPLAVVVFQGTFRRGKSYLASKLAGCPVGQGFGVGNDVNRKTLGFWIWNQVIIDKKTGKAIVVIDCEGTNSPKVNEAHDIGNFAIASLFASTLILNTTGAIDAKSLEQLELVTKISQTVCIEAGKQVDVSSLTDIVAKLFIWLIRDQTLKIVNEDSQPISATEYLEQALKQKPINPNGNIETQTRSNNICRAITDTFPQRKCVTMIRPTNEENLPNLINLPESKLNDTFVDQLHDFISMVRSSCPIKTILGKQYNGPMLSALLKGILAAMNNGAQPAIMDQWSATAQNQCLGQVHYALDKFNQQFYEFTQNGLVEDPEGFEKRLNQTRMTLLEEYHQKALPDFAKQYESQLVKSLDEKIENLRITNRNMVEKSIKAVFTGLNDEVLNPKSNNNEQQNASLDGIRLLYQKYHHILIDKVGKSQYIKSIWNASCMENIWNWMTVLQSKLMIRLEQLTNQLATLTKDLKLLEEEKKSLNKQLEEEVKTGIERVNKLSKALEEASTNRQIQVSELQGQLVLQTNTHAIQIQTMQDKMESLTKLSNDQATQLDILQLDLTQTQETIQKLNGREAEWLTCAQAYEECKERVIELDQQLESNEVLYKTQIEQIKKQITEVSEEHEVTIKDLEHQALQAKQQYESTMATMTVHYKRDKDGQDQKLAKTQEELFTMKDVLEKQKEDHEANTNVLQQRLQVLSERYEALKKSSQETLDKLTIDLEATGNKYDVVTKTLQDERIQHQEVVTRIKEQLNLELQNKTSEIKELKEIQWKSELETKSKMQQFEMELKYKSDVLEGHKRRLDEDAEDRIQHKKLKSQHGQVNMELIKMQSSVETLTKEKQGHEEKIKDMKLRLSTAEKKCREAELSKETEFIKLKVAHEKQLSLLKRSSGGGMS